MLATYQYMLCMFYNNLEIRVLTGSFGRPQLRSPNKVAKWIEAESKCNIKMFEWNQRIS